MSYDALVIIYANIIQHTENNMSSIADGAAISFLFYEMYIYINAPFLFQCHKIKSNILKELFKRPP